MPPELSHNSSGPSHQSDGSVFHSTPKRGALRFRIKSQMGTRPASGPVVFRWSGERQAVPSREAGCTLCFGASMDFQAACRHPVKNT